MDPVQFRIHGREHQNGWLAESVVAVDSSQVADSAAGSNLVAADSAADSSPVEVVAADSAADSSPVEVVAAVQAADSSPVEVVAAEQVAAEQVVAEQVVAAEQVVFGLEQRAEEGIVFSQQPEKI